MSRKLPIVVQGKSIVSISTSILVSTLLTVAFIDPAAAIASRSSQGLEDTNNQSANIESVTYKSLETPDSSQTLQYSSTSKSRISRVSAAKKDVQKDGQDNKPHRASGR
ncbi:hypothetical protein JJD41_15870 [Oxynema sp. CENA135]|uniref:hypothetical protein n=1 Tax=Oxynema sp. CENA135 TaxID=984206 RepID=UPI00190BEA9A|nr:hypothetical protein [Oxynema sp. CENA135]MBK4731327.1 hypothetical protein [Oxynema sp. CENA135]